MDTLAIYALIMVGLFASLVAIHSLRPHFYAITVLLSRHLTYPYIVNRHKHFGPLTRASVALHTSYATVNVFLMFFHFISLPDSSRRAGVIAMINFILLIPTTHLSYMADIIGLSFRNCQRVHRAVGWMVIASLVFHVAVALITPDALTKARTSVVGGNDQLVARTIAATSLGVLAILALPYFRRFSYKLFLRSHQAFTITSLYGIWCHIPKDSLFSRSYLYIALGVLACTSLIQTIYFLYRNGLFSGNGTPRAVLASEIDNQATELRKDETESQAQSEKLTKMCLVLPRPLDILPGQYIKIWLPTINIWSWAQMHPFMVTSWSRQKKQQVLDLIIQPNGTLSADLVRLNKRAGTGYTSLPAFFTGPHGINQPVGCFENILLVASGAGIAAIVPYAKEIIHAYDTRTSNVRHVKLIWNAGSLEFVKSGSQLINQLLEDDVPGNGNVLNISIHVEEVDVLETHFGKNRWAALYRGAPDYMRIIDKVLEGDREKSAAKGAGNGRMLLVASVTDDLRDELRGTMRMYLGRRAEMIELEYQP